MCEASNQFIHVVQQTNLPFHQSLTFSTTLARRQHDRLSAMSECDAATVKNGSHSWLEVSMVVADAELIVCAATVTVN